MSQSFYGSICLTDLIEQAKKKHSAFTKADNGKIYANVTVWLNDELDKFGNIMSAQLNPAKDRKEADGRPYIGNFKQSQAKPISDRDISNMDVDIDTAEKGAGTNSVTEPVDDLPF